MHLGYRHGARAKDDYIPLGLVGTMFIVVEWMANGRRQRPILRQKRTPVRGCGRGLGLEWMEMVQQNLTGWTDGELASLEEVLEGMACHT
jgi:hypothetical protein